MQKPHKKKRPRGEGVWELTFEAGEGNEADEGFDEVAFGGDDVFDILVGLWGFGEVEVVLGFSVAFVTLPPFADDAFHCAVAVVYREVEGGGDSAHFTACTVGAGHKGVDVT